MALAAQDSGCRQWESDKGRIQTLRARQCASASLTFRIVKQMQQQKTQQRNKQMQQKTNTTNKQANATKNKHNKQTSKHNKQKTNKRSMLGE